jgi:NAD(P)-dependent dehydrogenase (short-subunit alcohol dehydrogenase family)
MGRAIVQRLAGSGAMVATTARSPLPDGQTVGLFVQADISTRQGVDTVAEQVLQRFGGVDILINTVGGSSAPSGGVLALTDEEWQKAINLNLFPAVRLDRAFIPGMLKQRYGIIIHVSSIQRRQRLPPLRWSRPPRKTAELAPRASEDRGALPQDRASN